MWLNNSNNIVIKLLVSPRLRIVRHLILWVLILTISISFVGTDRDESISTGTPQKYATMFSFAFLIILLNCFNIYVLTPRLLLKNKWGLYFFSLLGLVIVMIIFIILFEVFFGAGDGSEPDASNDFLTYLMLLINIVSGCQVFILLFAGTSTFVVFKRWILDMRQSEELRSATLQMELKLLENQINPHFLFNMLNNANFLIKNKPDVAIHIIGKLEEMLSYQMNENSFEKVILKKEILFLNDFLELEKIRRDFFTYTISEEGYTDNIKIPPLLFITFVENATKHSQNTQSPSFVDIVFKVDGDWLIFICTNSVPPEAPYKKQVGGIGLSNITRRLDLLYENNYSLDQTKTDTKYVVNLKLKI